MKKMLCLLLAVMMVLSLAACGGSDKPADAPAADGPKDPNAPQYYNVYMVADPTSMDISRVSDNYSNTVISQVMESIVRLEEKDGEYVMAAGDAQTWESNAEATVWTFHLGNNKWSDGQEVTAHDYVYSLQRSADPATGCPNEYFLEPLAGYAEVRDGAPLDTLGVKALDDKTLEITLAYALPSFLEMCSGTIYYPIRQDYVEKHGDQYGTEPGTFIGNGAYTMESWSHNSSIVLKKSETYWNAENVQIETVNMSILQDSNTSYTMYEAGDLDYVGTSQAEWIQKFTARDDTTYIHSATAQTNYAFYNTKDALFCNNNIRKAFTLAIDRADVNEMLFGGRHTPAEGWVPAAMAVGPVVYRDHVGSVIQAMYDEADAAGMTAKDYLLKGMEELGLGTDPASLDITFSLAGTDEWFRSYGEYLQQVYNTELGVDLKIDFNDWGIFESNLKQGNYQIGYMAWGAYYNDPYDMLSLFLSEFDSIQTGWANEEFDRLVKEAHVNMNEEERMAMYKAAEDILMKDECVVNPILFASSNSFFRNFVEGYTTLAFSNTGYKGMSTGGR